MLHLWRADMNDADLPDNRNGTQPVYPPRHLIAYGVQSFPIV
jgi:hypothetical protein